MARLHAPFVTMQLSRSRPHPRGVRPLFPAPSLRRTALCRSALCGRRWTALVCVCQNSVVFGPSDAAPPRREWGDARATQRRPPLRPLLLLCRRRPSSMSRGRCCCALLLDWPPLMHLSSSLHPLAPRAGHWSLLRRPLQPRPRLPAATIIEGSASPQSALTAAAARYCAGTNYSAAQPNHSGGQTRTQRSWGTEQRSAAGAPAHPRRFSRLTRPLCSCFAASISCPASLIRPGVNPPVASAVQP